MVPEIILTCITLRYKSVEKSRIEQKFQGDPMKNLRLHAHPVSNLLNNNQIRPPSVCPMFGHLKEAITKGGPKCRCQQDDQVIHRRALLCPENIE